MPDLSSPGSWEHSLWPGTQDASIPRETIPIRETHRPVDRSRVNEEDLPSLAFLWASPESLLPSGLSLNPVPASYLACPVGQGPWRTVLSEISPQPSCPGRLQVWEAALGRGLAHAEKTPSLQSRPQSLWEASLGSGASLLLTASKEKVTSLSQGVGGSATAASREQWGIPSAANPIGGARRCDLAIL